LIAIYRKHWSWRDFIVHSLVALGMLAALYAALWLVTGFDPIRAFMTATQTQQGEIKRVTARPYAQTILYDQIDFMLTAGWISLPLLIFALVPLWRHRDPRLTVVLLCLIQIETVVFSGLIPAETARLFLFLLPLLALPIALELTTWDWVGRMTVFVCMWVMTAVSICRIHTISVEPLDKLPEWLNNSSLTPP
jgi:hypothetical protein